MTYKFKTTFWDDFAIADRFGEAAVKETYKRAFSEWKHDAEYVTELSMVLNWRCWKHHREGRARLSELYADLWRNVDAWCYANLKGDDLRHYFETTD